MIERWTLKVRYRGIGWTLRAVRARLRPYRLPGWHERVRPLRGGRGVELGGPSAAFGDGGLFPVYAQLASLDNVQFAAETPHQGAVAHGATIETRGTPGRQWVREATDLSGLGEYDVVLASHILEHTADPLGALSEWRRVLRPGGTALVITPDPREMFDHRRSITTLEHLRGDRGRAEDDTTHLAEILELDDRRRSDDPAMTRADMEPLWRDNLRTRAMHHHVFDAGLLRTALEQSGFDVVTVAQLWPYHTVAIATARLPESTSSAASHREGRTHLGRAARSDE